MGAQRFVRREDRVKEKTLVETVREVFNQDFTPPVFASEELLKRGKK